MPPIRPDDHAYRFRPAKIRELRDELKLTQSQMAALLEIPTNTLSRWETGANLPDANALAAIYSIATDRGVTPQFFEERSKTMSKFQHRKIRFIDWDFQNLGRDAEFIGEIADELNQYLNILCGRPQEIGKWAYVPAMMDGYWGAEHSPQGKALQEAGFDLMSCQFNADRQIIEDGRDAFGLPHTSQSKATNGDDPKEHTYVLISDDGDYAEYLKDLRNAGVETFVCGTDECSKKLIKAVGQDHFIPINRPDVILECLKVIRKLKSQPIKKSEFGNLCRKSLANDGWDELPDDTGFSLNRPYASALQHMVSMGIVTTTQVANDPNHIIITETQC